LEEALTKTPALLLWRVTGVIIYKVPASRPKIMCHIQQKFILPSGGSSQQ
jgi:hypothetical protein